MRSARKTSSRTFSIVIRPRCARVFETGSEFHDAGAHILLLIRHWRISSSTHPEIALNPAYYLGARANGLLGPHPDHAAQVVNMWERIMSNLVALCAFGLAARVVYMDVPDISRRAAVEPAFEKRQADVHTKLLDRFSTSEELMAYIATLAGSKFLQSAPICGGPGITKYGDSVEPDHVVRAGRAGAGGGGHRSDVCERQGVDYEASQLLQVLGILALALGAGSAISAGVAYLLSQRMGLLDSDIR